MRESEMTAERECAGCAQTSIRIYRTLPRELIESQLWKNCGHKYLASQINPIVTGELLWDMV